MKLHSKLSPSKASVWTECTAMPGYVEANADKLVPERPSVYAEEGTQAHGYAEDVLRTVVGVEEIPDEFRPHVRTYVEACQHLITPNSMVLVEYEVPLFYRPEDYGTMDFAVLSDKGLHFRDLKYGSGQLVHSEYNKQIAIYAWSVIVEFWSLFDFEDDLPITIHPIQPRHHEWVDVPWTTTVGELRTFIEIEINNNVQVINEGTDVQFAPGIDTCRWCQAKGFCEARAQWLTRLPYQINPLENCDNLDTPQITTLTEAQLLTIYRHKKEIVTFVEDVETYLTQMAASGLPLKGTKLVAGRDSNRKWVDENETNKELIILGLADFDDRYESKLRSPAKVEKILKDKGINVTIDSLTTRTKGQPVLALASDKRPALSDWNMAIDNLDEGDE